MNLIVRWCLFARIIKFYISFLSAFHSEKISSVYLFHSSGFVLLRLIISVTTDAIKMFAKVTAIFVPIAVLCIWRRRDPKNFLEVSVLVSL